MLSANPFKYVGIIVMLVVLFKTSNGIENNFFTAAVYEHPRQGDFQNKTPKEVRELNLNYYEKAARVAKQHGADLIVFPEYGIFPPGDREQMKKYVEVIPNPKENRVVPCDEDYSKTIRPILFALSCIAKVNSIVVVANTGGIEDCSNEPNCSTDGNRHLNANVAFDQNGTLIGRYYKEHLYFELGMDLPKEKQDPTFVTNFGKFAMFICFDSIFREMSEIFQSTDIDAVAFSTMWINSAPFFISTQWWQAWAMGNNATLLSSNIQIPGYFSAGSGIYTGKDGSIVSTLTPDGRARLLISTVPKRNKSVLPQTNAFVFTENGTEEWTEDGRDVPERCSYSVLGEAKDIFKDYRCFNENTSNYTLVKLTKESDHLTSCHNGMCCELEYSANSMHESFYFGVFNGTHIPYFRYPWSEENCFLARCDDVNGTACSDYPLITNTYFQSFSLKANFTSNHTFPFLLSSKMTLVPMKDWSYKRQGSNASVGFSSNLGIQILTAGLKGRAFDRDPPYQR